MSETDDAAVLAALRRQLADAVSYAHQAIALASAANVRLDALAKVVERLESRINNLKAESRTITDITG